MFLPSRLPLVGLPGIAASASGPKPGPGALCKMSLRIAVRKALFSGFVVTGLMRGRAVRRG